MRGIIRLSLILCIIFTIAITGCGSKGVRIDFNPIDESPVALNFTPERLHINGNYAYVAAKGNGLHIFDISDPVNPAWLQCLETPGEVWDVYVESDLAYIADGNAGLQIADVSSPAAPKIIHNVETEGEAYGIRVKDGYAFVADGENGMQVVDVEPLNMSYIVRNVPTSSHALSVKLSRGNAYIGCSQGLEIADISVPSKALQINSNSVKESFGEFDIRGDYAYYAHRDGLYFVYKKKPRWAYVKGLVSPEGAVRTLQAQEAFECVTYS